MKPANARPDPLAPLLALLEEDLAATLDGVPPRLWDRALLDPLREFLSRPGKEVRARLVETAWHAAGGDAAGPPEVLPLLTEILHAGSLIIDDIEDGSTSRRGGPALHTLVGTPLALNAGNFLYFWPQRLLARLDLRPRVRLALHEALSSTLLSCHRGQALDLSVRVFDLARNETRDVVDATTRLKTGSLMAFAARSGAVCAGAPDTVVDALTRFGREAGVALQMLDDLSGILNDHRRDKGEEDLRLARPTWIWAWLADDLDDVTYAGALQRLRAVEDGEAPDALRAWLRSHFQRYGPSQARAQVGRAVATVGDVLGGSAPVEGFRREMERLEDRYVRA